MEKEKREFINGVKSCLSFYPCFSENVKLFIACQFALESAFGTSRLARDCSNFSGMRFPLVRITTSRIKDHKTGFAVYSSLIDCVHDYVLCLQYHQPLRKELEDLILFKGFIKWYCPEKDYINKIINLFNLYQNGKDIE